MERWRYLSMNTWDTDWQGAHKAPSISPTLRHRARGAQGYGKKHYPFHGNCVWSQPVYSILRYSEVSFFLLTYVMSDFKLVWFALICQTYLSFVDLQVFGSPVFASQNTSQRYATLLPREWQSAQAFRIQLLVRYDLQEYNPRNIKLDLVKFWGFNTIYLS
jgi:hypothetical protein